jgi:hypothetical protein
VWGNNVSLSLSIFRDLYTLDWNKVKSYQVGSCTNENPKPEIEDAELMVYSVSQFDLASNCQIIVSYCGCLMIAL